MGCKKPLYIDFRRIICCIMVKTEVNNKMTAFFEDSFTEGNEGFNEEKDWIKKQKFSLDWEEEEE